MLKKILKKYSIFIVIILVLLDATFRLLSAPEQSLAYLSQGLIEANLVGNSHEEYQYAFQLAHAYEKKPLTSNKIFALGLYNYALQVDPKNQKNIRKKIGLIFQEWIQENIKKRIPIEEILEQQAQNRATLSMLRSQISSKLNKLSMSSGLEEIITFESDLRELIRKYFVSLINQALDVAGLPPCQYAFIGFGSYAQYLMTHYSDFEFGILIQDDTEQNKEYFRRVSELIYMSVVNLGETILPGLGIPEIIGQPFYDSITPRGFSLDGIGVPGKGGVTPIRWNKDFELIQSPSGMAEYLYKADDGSWWHSKNQYLCMELVNFSWICGDCGLLKQYEKHVDLVLSRYHAPGETMRQFFSMKHMVQEDFQRLSPRLKGDNIFSAPFQVKHDLYRCPQIIISRLILSQNIKEKGVFKSIYALHRIGVISNEGKDHLLWLCAKVLLIRLKTYDYYKAQREQVALLRKKVTNKHLIYIMDSEEIDILREALQIIISLNASFKKYSCGESDDLKKNPLFCEDPCLLADIDYRLGAKGI